jgi:hypothetical protein
MRTFLLALAALGVFGQDEARLRELVRALDDDSIDAREEAQAELVRMGEAKLPALRELERRETGERRNRILEVIRRIEARQRLAAVLRPASLVTLRAEARPVREVLEELRRQAPATPLEIGRLADGEAVTVSLAGVPFWEALDAVCRASGRIMYRVQNDRVTVRAEKYAAMPRRVTGPLGVWLQSISIQSPALGMPGGDQFVVQLQACWEKGTRPYGLRLESQEILDDQGADLSDARTGAFADTGGVGGGAISHPLQIYSNRIPSWKSARLSRLRLVVAVDFAVQYDGVTFEDPAGKGGATLACERFGATLQRLTRTGRTANVSVTVAGLEDERGMTFYTMKAAWLRDKEGKEYPGQCTGASGSDRNMTYHLRFTIPEQAELAALSIRLPKEVHTERLELDLKDLPIE